MPSPPYGSGTQQGHKPGLVSSKSIPGREQELCLPEPAHLSKQGKAPVYFCWNYSYAVRCFTHSESSAPTWSELQSGWLWFQAARARFRKQLWDTALPFPASPTPRNKVLQLPPQNDTSSDQPAWLLVHICTRLQSQIWCWKEEDDSLILNKTQKSTGIFLIPSQYDHHCTTSTSKIQQGTTIFSVKKYKFKKQNIINPNWDLPKMTEMPWPAPSYPSINVKHNRVTMISLALSENFLSCIWGKKLRLSKSYQNTVIIQVC